MKFLIKLSAHERELPVVIELPSNDDPLISEVLAEAKLTAVSENLAKIAFRTGYCVLSAPKWTGKAR
jgi:hypothetical protein